MTYSYTMLPVLVRQLRLEPYCPILLREFIDGARTQLLAQEVELLGRRKRFCVLNRSRLDLRSVGPCFECEHRALLYAMEALNSLEAFLESGNHSLLSEAMADFGASDIQYEKLIQLRKRLPALLEESLQRVA